MQEDRPLPAPSFFFHPDCHCRLRSCTESALRLVGYTTGRDLHPALKILIRLFCGVFPDMPCRSSKQFLQTLAKETPRTPGSGRDNGAQNPCATKNSGTNTFQSSHPTRKSRHCSLAHFVFFHPDYTVGFGIAPNHALRLVGYTTGRDLHPALKILFIYETSICVCQRFVKLFFAKHIKILCPRENFSKKRTRLFS